MNVKTKVLEVVLAKVNEWNETNEADQVKAQLKFNYAEDKLNCLKNKIEKFMEEMNLLNKELLVLEKEVEEARLGVLSLV